MKNRAIISRTFCLYKQRWNGGKMTSHNLWIFWQWKIWWRVKDEFLMGKKRNCPLPWRWQIYTINSKILITKVWPKTQVKYFKLCKLNLLTIKIEFGLLNKSIGVIISLLRNIGLRFNNIQQRLQKLKINIMIWVK